MLYIRIRFTGELKALQQVTAGISGMVNVFQEQIERILCTEERVSFIQTNIFGAQITTLHYLE